MGQPQLQEADNRAAIDGLEEIFDVEVGQAQNEAHLAHDQAQGQDHPEAHVSVSEAAQRLGVDRRYTLRLVHIGKLIGYKDSTGRWLVSVDSINVSVR